MPPRSASAATTACPSSCSSSPTGTSRGWCAVRRSAPSSAPPADDSEGDDTVIDETLFEAEEKMEKAVHVARDELGGLRTGRANASAFARLVVDYYGTPTPIPQMATVNVPEARMAIIKPYDPSQLGAIEKAIRDSDLGVNPTNDGTIIRIVFPQLTEERRRDLVKVARGKGEDA